MTDSKPLAIVTGASSGIGFELARQFAENGFDLLITAEDKGLRSTARQLQAGGAHIQSVQTDLAVLLRSIQTRGAAAVEVVAVDAGPGIRDVSVARRDGYSTTGTLGIGLGAATRLADALDISSAPGRGTVVVARFEVDRGVAVAADANGPDAAGITRALSGEAVCGDGYATRQDGGRTSLMACDGSGHGPMAAVAAREAIRTFDDPDQPVSPPETVVRRIHRALAGTRGAAVGVMWWRCGERGRLGSSPSLARACSGPSG